jgi:hypothetical protein
VIAIADNSRSSCSISLKKLKVTMYQEKMPVKDR